MGLFDKKEEGTAGVDTQEAPRGDSGQDPDATPASAPVDAQDDQGQATAGDDGKDQGAIDDALVPEENLDPDGRDEEVDKYPSYYMEGVGHIAFYVETRYPVEACVGCGLKHPKGQFDTCDNCGLDITEHRGTMTDGKIVAV